MADLKAHEAYEKTVLNLNSKTSEHMLGIQQLINKAIDECRFNCSIKKERWLTPLIKERFEKLGYQVVVNPDQVFTTEGFGNCARTTHFDGFIFNQNIDTILISWMKK